MKETADEIIAELERKYKDNPDALDEIERAKETIAYIKEKEKQGGYTGQPSLGHAEETRAILHDWY